MTALQPRRRGFNDADLRYAYRALLALRDARGESDVAAARASDPELRAIALRARAAQDHDILAITTLLDEWGQGRATDPDGPRAPRRGPGYAVSDLRSLDEHELDRRCIAMLTGRAEAAIVSARSEMVEGFEGTARQIAQSAIRSNSRDLTALGRLTPVPTRSREAGTG